MNQEILISLFALTLLEIILGIDNIIFISILANKAPNGKQKKLVNTACFWGWLFA